MLVTSRRFAHADRPARVLIPLSIRRLHLVLCIVYNPFVNLGLTLPHGVYRNLRQEILAGRIAPGSTLREEHIAEQFKVSRTPVREALRRLADEGFVEYQPHKGARLLFPTKDLVRETFQIREMLEATAAREAAARIDKSRWQFLRDTFDRLRTRVAAGDLSDVGDGLHLEMLRASGNKRLAQLLLVCEAQMLWFQSMFRNISHRKDSAFWEHEGILSALEIGDPVWAESAVRAHIRASMWCVLEVVGARQMQDNEPFAPAESPLAITRPRG